jgi:ADP-ribose pyrophosphatase YjhB (NUDIX family)
MKKGVDYIGVGVGAMTFNADGLVFLALRGDKVRNEPGCWEFPGGGVRFGERLEDAVRREFLEEYGIRIRPVELLCVTNHILRTEHQHWVSPTFIAMFEEGEPAIREPEKCSRIGWFPLDALPSPLMTVSQNNVEEYAARFGRTPYPLRSKS